MLEHQVNVNLAREKDAEDLANGIQWCVENNKDRKLSAAARKKVMENYTIERVGELYKRVYEGMINI